MASIYKRADGGAAFQCEVVVPKKDGTRKPVRVSLGITDRKLAKRVAGKVQGLADTLEPAKKKTQAQLMNAIEAIFHEADVPPPWEVGASNTSFTVFAKAWLDRKRAASSKATINVASATIEEFATIAGDKPMSGYSGHRIQEWHDSLVAAGYASNTVNVRFSIIKAIFKHAVSLGAIQVNPAAAIQVVKGESVLKRQELPDDIFEEISAWLMKQAADRKVDRPYFEWVQAMNIARYAGLRLGDCVKVKRKDFSYGSKHSILCYTAGKTGRPVCVPIFPPLRSLLIAWKESSSGDYFMPVLASKSASYLSESFTDIITAAGVENPVVKLPSGRDFQALSFHGLRHAFVSDLARRGVPENLRMILSDHTTKKAHATYDHSTAADLADKIAPYFQ